MTTLGFQHATPAFRTFCGEGSLAGLGRELDRVGAGRAVICSDPAIARHHPKALEAVETALGGRLAGRFDGVREHSPIDSVEEARDLFAQARADAVVAVGGGSAVVTARAATILYGEGNDIRELCTRRDGDGRLFSPRLSEPKLPQWVVPSTPITAYAKAGAAVRDHSTGDRLALFDPKARAQGIFVDPAMALTAPLRLVQASALNAFAMAVESLQVELQDPLADALLLHALTMLTNWLPRLVREPDDPEPRMQLMLAALLCGQGSDYVGGGLAQALSHAAGPRSSVANGVVEALLLPHTMRFAAALADQRFVQIADILDGDTATASPTERAIAAVERFLAGLSVPTRLRDVGVGREVLPEIVAHAADDFSITRVPGKPGPDDLAQVLDAAF
jgi:alcohol dehydrogenase class IV